MRAIVRDDVRRAGEATPERVTFCSHCGNPPDSLETSRSRICDRCQLGLLLEARAELAPAPGDAFVVIDEELRVCALSDGAERLLGIGEPLVIHRSIDELLTAADGDERERGEPLRTLRAAARRPDRSVSEATLVGLGGLGGPFKARIGACIAPPAVLVLLSETG
jgi:PAS domain-containing protein